MPAMTIPAARCLALVVLTIAAAHAARADEATERGHGIVKSLCSRCHAVEKRGASPRKEALPFREISKRYPLRNLEEALAEGIVTGHNDMPAFQFEPDEIDAILAYIDSISAQPAKP
jgi:mono/diheme cytochrome c family protein